jgi:hypothetical protein
VAPESGLANHDQAGLPQVGQVPRDSGLWGKKDFHKVPDAVFPTQQSMENPQASPVRESPEHQIDTVQSLGLSSLGHIRGLRACVRAIHQQGHFPYSQQPYYALPGGNRQASEGLSVTPRLIVLVVLVGEGRVSRAPASISCKSSRRTACRALGIAASETDLRPQSRLYEEHCRFAERSSQH